MGSLRTGLVIWVV